MRRGGSLIAGIAALGLLLAPSAGAKTFEVTRTADTAPNGCNTGGCTLREAVLAANNRSGADTIVVKSRKRYELTIPGTFDDLSAMGDLDATGPTTIRSSNPARRATIDGAGLDRVIDAFGALRLGGLRITGGDTSGQLLADAGAAVRSNAGTLAIERSAIAQNVSVNAAVDTFGDQGMRVTRTSFTGNSDRAIRDSGEGGIKVVRTRVRGGEAEGIEDLNGGGVRVVRSSVANVNDRGIEDNGPGGVVLVRSRVSQTDSQGVQDFDEGGVELVRSLVERTGSQGVQDFDDGGVLLTRSVVRSTESQGVQDFDAGSVAIVRSVVSGNEREAVQDFGEGGIRVSRSKLLANGGGVLLDEGFLRLDRSTVARNVNDDDGAGIAAHGGVVTVTDSTIERNTTTDGSGGGIYVGPIALLKATNSTFSGNRADLSGGALRIEGEARLNAVTVVRNVANYQGTSINTSGGGINVNNAGFLTGTRNSLFALNQAANGASFPDCNANLASAGHNLLTNTDGCSGLVGSDDEIGNPKISPLKRNGGPTETVALKKGSPAIGKAGNDAPNRDQRGHKRDGNPDVGAFER